MHTLIKTLPLLVLFAAAPVLAAPDEPAKPAAPAAPPAWVYPRDITSAGRRLSLHEPVVLLYDPADTEVALRFPVTVTDALGRITYGVIDATGTVHLDVASRLFRADEVAVGKSAFPGLADPDAKSTQAGLAEVFPKSMLFRIELLTARPAGKAAVAPESPKFATQPPAIFVRNKPAVLLQTDGEPLLLDIESFPVQYLANSASDVFRDAKADVWYFLLDGGWMQSKALAGPWEPLKGALPTTLSQLKDDHPRGHIRRYVPGTPEFSRRGSVAPMSAQQPPEVIVTDKPSELVLLKGDPLFMLVPGVKLMVVANTESDLFFHPKTAAYYLLVSGRWFSADELDGPWKETFGALPEELAKVPRDHVRGHVAWCVPGTPEAGEACAQAALEEHAGFSKGTIVEVKYEGKGPNVVAVEGDLKMATNTDDDVFVVGTTFYVCQRGVWYRSDDGRSPWKPVVELPPALRAIPPGSGAYQDNAVRPHPDAGELSVFGTTSGYYGVFPWKGSPVHGTGWPRRGMLRNANWYPAPRSYGENRWYDPITGVFQPRTVRYQADGTALADEWSPYTASYGRVDIYGSRYDQGGRRMFHVGSEDGKIDTAVARPDVYALWFSYVKTREGMKPEELPLGDRRGETAPTEARLAADETGKVWRLSAAGVEGFEGGKWAAAKPAPEVQAWLETEARIDARPAQWKTWRALRAAPLPVNPTVTPRK